MGNGNKKITVFTPTFNRRQMLIDLYKSLCAQTSKAFVWLIVDDGSTDDTRELVETFISDHIIDITYFYQNNAGKCAAHNTGVSKTQTEFFVCVDSDDILVPEAIETIEKESHSLSDAIGLMFAKGKKDYSPLQTWKVTRQYATLHYTFHKMKIKCDVMLVYKTSLLKTIQFPSFDGESFVPESYLYYQLDLIGELKIVDKVLYLCDYYSDGYSRNIRKYIAKNPKGYCAAIEKSIVLDTTLLEKAKDIIKYISVSFCTDISKTVKEHRFLSFLLFIPSFFVYLIVYKKHL